MSPLVQWSIGTSSKDRVPPTKEKTVNSGFYSTYYENNGFWFLLGWFTDVKYIFTLFQNNGAGAEEKKKILLT